MMQIQTTLRRPEEILPQLLRFSPSFQPGYNCPVGRPNDTNEARR